MRIRGEHKQILLHMYFDLDKINEWLKFIEMPIAATRIEQQHELKYNHHNLKWTTINPGNKTLPTATEQS